MLVTLLWDATVAGKYEQMVVLGSALCCWRWRNHQAAAKTRFLCFRLIASMVLDLFRTLFLCVYRKRVTA